MKDTHTLTTISEFHQLAGLSAPKHPLVSLVDYGKVDYQTNEREISWIQQFYSIGLKRNIQGKFRYGQMKYDFNEGLMAFVAPGQIVRIATERPDIKPSGYLLFVHPDFLWNTALARTIKRYEFFGYAVTEALFLSESEETIIIEVVKSIQREYDTNIDRYTQNIIISQIEVLLNYCERFYQRQFLTRDKVNHQLLAKLENELEAYFKDQKRCAAGLPTAQSLAAALNMSPNYLGSLLKNMSGRTTQQHIHDKIIEKAKEALSTTSLSVNEIAYQLGFEQPQSFSRLFKSKTNWSPQKFRATFN